MPHTAGAPRSTRGGKSHRYEERRSRRGVEAKHAPGWTDSAAELVRSKLEMIAGKGKMADALRTAMSE